MLRKIALCSALLLGASVIAAGGVQATSRTSETGSCATTDWVSIPLKIVSRNVCISQNATLKIQGSFGGAWVAERPIVSAPHRGLHLGRPRNLEPVSLAPSVTVRKGSPAQLRRLAQALDRFATAGLALPDLEVVFMADESGCKTYLGLFDPSASPWRISICSAIEAVYEHELAHAWERGSMSDETRRAFMELRGYSMWKGSEVPWNERGIEGVAYIIQQGLNGLPLPPRLGVEQLSRLQAFEFLTGFPDPRLLEWETHPNRAHISDGDPHIAGAA